MSSTVINNKKKRKFRSNQVSRPAEVAINVLVGAFALLCILPFIFIIIISFTSADSLRIYGYSFFPAELSTDSFAAAFTMGNVLWRSYGVSFLVTVVGTLLSMFVSLLYAYGLYRRDYPLRNFFAIFIFITMIFGGGLVPTVMVIRNLLGLGDTLWALIIPSLILPFHVIILRTFLSSAVPETLIESARLDGAGEFRTLLSIVVPIVKPGLATVALLTAIGYWNDWWLAMLFIRDRTLFPLQYLLMEFQQNVDFVRRNLQMIGDANIDFAALPSEGLRMALAVLIVLPIACAYPFFQRYIVTGLTVGAVKG
ncbi:MAG: carbohydrate ABC transporter permease [Oscillospiraceae bacterium]|nr:carbohydrate ABC transporter permease [Oscillospiraceae bacterium]MCL2278403.1 carbohydrate ABC transporter permease [Oscillospiraceae bacterium]